MAKELPGTYCPPEQMTLDWEMTKIRYAVIIQQMDSRSPQHIRLFGTVISGNKLVDSVVSESDLHTEMGILKIIETYYAGKEIRIVKKTDLLKIYKVVNLFLTQWSEKIQHDFLGNAFPLEELAVIERFASYLYDKCYEVGLEVVTPDVLSQQYRKHGVNLMELDSLLKSNIGLKEEIKTVVIPERQSLEPFFNKELDDKVKGGIFWNSDLAHYNER